MKHVLVRRERPMANGRWLFTCSCGMQVQAAATTAIGAVVNVGQDAGNCPACFRNEAPDPMRLGQMFSGWAPDALDRDAIHTEDPRGKGRASKVVEDPGYKVRGDEIPREFRGTSEQAGDRVLGTEWSW